MTELVSILIPAYNSSAWIADTIKSAIGQSWRSTEIIVVDDGSTDDTVSIARAFESNVVKVVSKDNEGAAATRNLAFELSQGRYIQWLDADDLLSPGKIERQMQALQKHGDHRKLLSCPWAYFACRPEKARFTPTPLWADLTATEWLVRKLGQNLHQQTATWLTSRDLADAAGGWNTAMHSDDDGEYFTRVLMSSSGTLFVPKARVYYRRVPGSRLSYIGNSKRKMTSMLLSIQLHVSRLLSLEDSPRIRQACIAYLHTWAQVFDPERQELLKQIEAMVQSLGGEFETPRLRWKYDWLCPIIGRTAAWHLQRILPYYKGNISYAWDKLLLLSQPRPELHLRAEDG